MKKIRIIALLLCICMILPSTPLVKAAEKQGAEAWILSNIELSHTSLSLQISSVDKAQNAVLFIQTSDSSSTEEDIITYGIPFSITSSTENITIDIPDGRYITPGYYDVYVKDADGNESSKSRSSLKEHHYSVSFNAYPNRVEVKNNTDASFHASATVGFQEYKIDLGAKETGLIEYPNQTNGTAIELKCWDDYGCSSEYTPKVKNENLTIPSICVWKDSITALDPRMSADERIGVEVEGKTYYSSYGAENKTIPDIVTYPQVADSTSKIKVWLESKNGSRSEPEEYDIQACKLDACKKTCSACMAKATGYVAPNDYGNSITKVATTIDNIEYSCDVASDGTYCLEYPEQKPYSSVNIRFIDKHGCEISSEYTIKSSLYGKINEITVLPSRAYANVRGGTRIAVKIDGQIYYSDYAPSPNDSPTRVAVSYPVQKPGKEISVWYEEADTSKSPVYHVTLAERKYEIFADVRVSSITGSIVYLGDIENSGNYNVYVLVNGIEYKADLDDYDFSCSFPKQKIGDTITVIVRDSDDYEYSESFLVKNFKPKINLKKVNTSIVMVQGTTTAGSLVTVKVKNKKYTGKANKNGNFSIKIKPGNAGTKVTVNVVTPEGYTNSKTTKISKVYGDVELSSNVFRTSTKAKFTVMHGVKGDNLKIKIGNRTYTKKLKSNKNKQKINISIKKAAAGSKIKIALYDKFGAKKGTDSDMVYYGTKIYVGMSARDAALTTWGSPVRRNNWGTGYEQWVFRYGKTTLYAYVKNGKVCKLQHLNY